MAGQAVLGRLCRKMVLSAPGRRVENEVEDEAIDELHLKLAEQLYNNLQTGSEQYSNLLNVN